VTPPPRAYPLVGHVPSFLADKLGFLELAARTGAAGRLRLRGPTRLLTEPDDIRHVLVGAHAKYVKSLRLTGASGRRLFGDGLLRSSGEAHRRRRLLLQPLFHQRTLEVFAEAVLATTSTTVERWRPGSEVDMAAAMSRLAQRVMLRTLFGPLPEGEDDRLAAAIDARRRYIEHVFLSLLPLRERLPTRVRRRHLRAAAELDAVLAEAIAERRGRGGRDVLSLLLEARGDDGARLSDADVRDEALTLAITGFETLGDALAWTWYLLAQHPDAYERLAAELDAVVGAGPPRVQDLPRLLYAQLVLAESLRLYPPTWLYVRVALAADRLPSGATVERGSKVYLCPYVSHRDARFFRDPERFDPERFSPAAVRERPKHAYFPFGSGPHVCLGEAFARMEAGLVLALVARRFRPELADDAPVTPRPGITLTPGGPLRMVLQPRLTAYDVASGS
jgi:cytochrome P450